jgi:hypothetical protein
MVAMMTCVRFLITTPVFIYSAQPFLTKRVNGKFVRYSAALIVAAALSIAMAEDTWGDIVINSGAARRAIGGVTGAQTGYSQRA